MRLLANTGNARAGPTNRLGLVTPVLMLAFVVFVVFALSRPSEAQESHPPPVGSDWGDLVPYLVSRSYRDVPRPAPTDDQIREIRSESRRLRTMAHAPGAAEELAFANHLVKALKESQYGYFDALHVLMRVQSALSAPVFDRKALHALVREVEATLKDTDVRRSNRHELAREVRELGASAINELP